MGALPSSIIQIVSPAHKNPNFKNKPMSLQLIIAGHQKHVYYVTEFSRTIKKKPLSSVTSLINPTNGKPRYFIMFEDGSAVTCTPKDKKVQVGNLTCYFNPMIDLIREGKTQEIARLQRRLNEKKDLIEDLTREVEELEKSIRETQQIEESILDNQTEVQATYLQLLQKHQSQSQSQGEVNYV